MDIKTVFNPNQVVWVINNFTPSKSKVYKVELSIFSFGNTETVFIDTGTKNVDCKCPYYVSGVYENMAFLTEEEMLKELSRRVNRGSL